MNPDTARLVARSLACRRSGRSLFEALSFEVGCGDLMQVMGPNGSGKTSLLRILCGLRQQDDGEVHWCGQPISEADDAYTENLSYIGFQSALKPELTPLENLGFARALARACRMDAGQALARVRLDALAERPCRQLSTGQARRVALARLLMLGRCLWILDEPLTGLDEASRQDFEQIMLDHVEQGGIVILTTHHPIRRAGSPIKSLELGG